jgi:hypothetical protein
MKIFIRTLVFHFVCIIMFSLLYLNVMNDDDNREIKYIDCLMLSTAVQSGVGLSNTSVSNSMSKMILMLQQLVLISTHVFTIYIFTI